MSTKISNYDFNVKVYEEDKNIETANIANLNITNMKIYGANINLARVFPEIHDGLKLVERRILYTMYTASDAVKYNVKSVSIIGDTMKIHPHGDASIYETMVRISQPWNMVIPYIRGKGNFGTVLGEDAAAHRYTEARLSDYAIDCFFSDWDPEIVTMIDSYDHKKKEPVYLPTKYPNCLLSSADGMGFGSATHVPTFNLEEILQTTIKLIKNPNAEIILYPDITTGCNIIDSGNFKELCETGKSNFKMRGEIEKDEHDHCLIIKSVPFQVSLQKVKEKFRTLVEEKIINGFKAMKEDIIEKQYLRLVLYFRPEVDLDNVISILYAKADLQATYPAQMKLVDNFKIRDFSVRSALLRWIDIRMEFKERKFTKRMIDLEARDYILSVLIKMLSGKNAEETIELIRHSTKDEVIKAIMKKYSISSLQAREIANMKLSAFSKTAKEEYLKEYPENEDLIKKYNQILDDPKNIADLIIKELEDGIKKYSAPRRSKVIKMVKDYKYSGNEVVLIFTKNGYVKKLDAELKQIGNLGDMDTPIDAKKINNRDEVVIFDKRGSIHTFEVGQIKADTLNSIGSPLSTYINITGMPVAIFNKKDLKDDMSFIFVTKHGIIKKTGADNFAFKNSLLSITLKPDDELVSVIAVSKDIDILVYSKYGFGTRFNTKEIPDTKRMAIGVIGFPLAENDKVIGVQELAKHDDYIFLLTEKGYGKKCSLEVLASKKRRSEPVSLINLKEHDKVLAIINCNNKDYIHVVLKNNIYDIPMKEIKESMKFGIGDKLIPVKRGDTIVKIYK